MIRKRVVAVAIILVAFIAVIGISHEKQEKEIKDFTAFFDVQKSELNAENDIKEMIAEITGARCWETWLVGQSRDTVINTYIASGEYPDFISGSSELYEAGALVALDEYLDDYPYL